MCCLSAPGCGEHDHLPSRSFRSLQLTWKMLSHKRDAVFGCMLDPPTSHWMVMGHSQSWNFGAPLDITRRSPGSSSFQSLWARIRCQRVIGDALMQVPRRVQTPSQELLGSLHRSGLSTGSVPGRDAYEAIMTETEQLKSLLQQLPEALAEERASWGSRERGEKYV